MRGYIVLLFASCAFAAPQYNYQQGPGLGGSTGGFTSGGSIGGGSIGGGSIGGGSFGGGSIGGGSFGGGSIGGGSFGGGSIGGGSIGGGSFGGGHSGSSQISGGQQGPIITKQFYLHAAPEEQDEEGLDKSISLGPSRKNYRVVFIKAPTSSVKSSRVRFQAPANEEKTVIYVLSKKTDVADLETSIDQAQVGPTKPEVFFIKYKTEEEARHAQRQIQAQYDSLGGTSQVSDEGLAPVSSVIGALGTAGTSGGHSGSSSSSFTSGSSFNTGSIGVTGGSSGSAYLPPNH